MNKLRFFVTLIALLVVLTSCWDRRLLKDHTLILAIGYDLNDNQTISKTVTFPREATNNEQQEAPSESEVMTTVGDTVGDSDIELERHLSQRFDRSKARILLLGEELAKYGMFPTLDSMYRDPRGPLNAFVAVVVGRAEEGLKIKKEKSFFKNEFYFGLLNSAEETGIIKSENVQSICPVLLSERKDIMLPLIKVDDADNAYIDGQALFSGDKMTGTLNKEESIMILLLTDNMTKSLKLNFQISEDRKKHEENYVTFAVRKEKRKLNIYEENNYIKVEIDINLRIEIEEFPQDHLYEKSKLEYLEERINEQLTKLAEETITTVKKANSDVFGIGEKVRAYYPSTWEKIEWNDVYPETPIDVTFHTEIIQHGIID